jgi:hypothetical protein
MFLNTIHEESKKKQINMVDDDISKKKHNT